MNAKLSSLTPIFPRVNSPDSHEHLPGDDVTFDLWQFESCITMTFFWICFWLSAAWVINRDKHWNKDEERGESKRKHINFHTCSEKKKFFFQMTFKFGDISLPQCGHFEWHHQWVTCHIDQWLFGHHVLGVISVHQDDHKMRQNGQELLHQHLSG